LATASSQQLAAPVGSPQGGNCLAKSKGCEVQSKGGGAALPTAYYFSARIYYSSKKQK